MANLRIFQPTKNPMQSGKGPNYWMIEFPRDLAASGIDPLMGWVSSADMDQMLRLRFPTKEEAIAYAGQYQLPYDVIDRHPRKKKFAQYSDNFTRPVFPTTPYGEFNADT